MSEKLLFERRWCVKHQRELMEAKTLPAVIAALQEATAALQAMAEAGVEMYCHFDPGDYLLRTDDPLVAKRFNMHPHEKNVVHVAYKQEE